MTKAKPNVSELSARVIAELRRDKKKTGILSVLLIVGIILAIKTLPAASGPTPAKASTSKNSKNAKVIPGCQDPRVIQKNRDKADYLRNIDTHITRDIFLPSEQAFPLPKAPEPVKTPASTPATGPSPEALQKEIERRAVLAEAATLTLQSTMLGARSVASINDKVLTVGEEIQGFRLVDIQSNRCTVTKNGVDVLLQITR